MILTLITFLLVLSVLIFAHEFGHFLAAKKAGIKVEEFGFGYPPRLFGKKFRGTIYSLNWLPFGGFVRLYGEQADKKIKSQDAFCQKNKKTRSLVLLAGVFFNFLLAIVVFTVVYSFSGIPTKTDKVKILGVIPGSPAAQSGLKENDKVLKIDDKTLKDSQAFIELIEKGKGQQLLLTIEREKDNPCETQVFGGMIGKESQPAFSCQEGKLLLWVVPRENPPAQEGPLGVIISDMEMKKYPLWQMPFRGMVEGSKEALAWLVLIIKALAGMFFNLFAKGVIPQDVAGPVGIFQITGLVAQTGFLNVLQFIGILSINLAVINLLPLPALDGGRLFYIFIYEGLFRRKSNPAMEAIINTIGIVFLFCLIILITFNDIKRMIGWDKIGQWLLKIWPF
ncbi:hypothetical protein CO169_01825 [Candidatus Shapirobacteria bacterium CG_4_9_14_3_um_filter_39_13]|uniref:PDZ domain-containing protein n=2 Tax=Candidatus Shapironibacteriota TaxID=1752721 RepID=A0A2M7XLJ5_9BACT|nr:MAG: hypothetical protein CO169_01825 [Candidatus Shapirobacteria bacterium CG_4_9_14_3_um_filter_39_13]PJC28464.1 MAG: hypothetical protein CO054_00025 [Candidatus Shapirobacteria bacterium CG_4_9_14_0_2_um_filter_39_11]